MIKWREFLEGDVLYEAFLPEHEREACGWLVRASCRGHVLAERRETLTWPPRFGPDVGDVAVLEAIADELVKGLATAKVPEGEGPYVPPASELEPIDLYVHAVLYALVEEYAKSEAALGLTVDQSTAYLSLPVRANARGLYPLAVTPERDHRMRRLIALDRVLSSRTELQPHKATLLEAVLASDTSRLRTVLHDLGVDIGSE